MFTRKGYHRLRAIGISPAESASIIRCVQRWAKSSGEEWTVQRLKVLKQDFLRHSVGLPPTEESATGVRIKRHADGSPHGPFRALWRYTGRRFVRAWNALMIYSGFTLVGAKVTERQFSRFVRAVNRPPVPAHVYVSFCQVIDKGSRYHLDTDLVVRPLYAMPLSDRRAPTEYVRTKKEAATVINSASFASMQAGGWQREHISLFAPLYEGLPPEWTLGIPNRRGRDTIISGMIGWLQEPGYKLRYIANPLRAYQCLLLPLKDACFKALRPVREDCTFNQDASVPVVQQWLAEGKTIYSFDLRNATDHFPLSVQLHMLRYLGLSEEWISVYEDICRGSWLFVDPFLDRMRPPPVAAFMTGDAYEQTRVKGVSWKVGSPLGLGPVFATFALAHGALIRGLALMSGFPPDFLVLGDDVVIAHDDLANHYASAMEQLGVPISADKTLVSDRVGEFAGRLIFIDKVVKGYKWRRHDDDSFLAVAGNLGPGSLQLFTSRQQAVIRALGSVPQPWGLGWNPRGLSYESRVGMWPHVVSADDPDPVVTRPGRNAQILAYEADPAIFSWDRSVANVDQTLDDWRDRYLKSLPLEISLGYTMRRDPGSELWNSTLVSSGDPAQADRSKRRSTLSILERAIRVERSLRKRREAFLA